MVWCVISREKVLGPYFFEDENLNSENYGNMLIHSAILRFASQMEDYIFHQDGASAHYSFIVGGYFHEKRLRPRMGRGGPVNWLPPSPDLTPCDFFLRVHFKEKLHATPKDSIEYLKNRIRRECRRIRLSVLFKGTG